MVGVAVVAIACGRSDPALAQSGGSADKPAPAANVPTAGQDRQRLSDSEELDRIVSLYSGGKYEECSREVAKLLDTDNPDRLVKPSAIEDARLYHATCLVMAGREKEAILPLRAALTENPTMGTPDSLTFPPPLISLFLKVRREFADAIKAEEKKRLEALERQAKKAKDAEEAEQRRVAKLQELAGSETLVLKNDRFVASLPFGIGQYQNGNSTLGTVFLLSEAALLGTAIGAVAVYNYQYTLLDREDLRKEDIGRNAGVARTVSIFGFYGFVAVAAGGIAEAHINFVPSVTKQQKRKLPAELLKPKVKSPLETGLLLPWVAPGRDSLRVGVMGCF